MDNNETKQISDILKYIYDGMLGRALRSTRSLVDANPHLIYDEELESIENDYRLMLDYMKRGFNDPQRGAIYQNLIVRLYRFTADLNMAYRKQNVQFFAEASGKASRKSFNNDNIKAELEGFVTDVAMLSLDPEPERTRKSNDIYRRHNDFTQSLFCHIVTSKQWGEHDAAFFEELLLSPAVDTIDAQLIISALTLATMNNMDANKFSVMMNVYLKTTDEHLRQKALIGWAFALSSEAAKVFPKLRESVSEALNDKNVVNELVDLQKQMVFCLNAEQDTATIRRDIMPELMKNNNLNITRFGITEKEDDPMADIFDPGASERAMEKMEESFQKMMNMQKAGSDIYFGGFSQMKRFPFFYNVANIVKRQIKHTPRSFASKEYLFKDFIELITSLHPKPRRVEYYAGKLCITPKYLSSACKDCGGMTATGFIDLYVLKDIKYLLTHTSMSIKEICNELDFPNLSFFGRYVKRHFGMSPKAYRDQALKEYGTPP